MMYMYVNKLPVCYYMYVKNANPRLPFKGTVMIGVFEQTC